MKDLSEWARALLEGRHYATLATRDPDGGAHLTPVWYLFQDEQIFVGAPSSSRKVRNVEARPMASLVVDVRIPGAERWVAGHGPVTLLRGEPSRAINAAILERYLTPEALRDPKVGPVFAAGDDVTLCIRPAGWRAWHSADLDRHVFGGLLSANREKYFRPVDPA